MKQKDRYELFVCCTPYHILTAVNTVLTGRVKADIVILEHFDLAKEYSEKLERCSIFSQVYFIPAAQACPGRKGIRTLSTRLFASSAGRLMLKIYHAVSIKPRLFFSYIVLKEQTNTSFVDYSKQYSRIYFTTMHLPNETILHYRKFCRNSIFCLYEDGLGTYSLPAVYEQCNDFRYIPLIDFSYELRVYSPTFFRMTSLECMKPRKIERIKVPERNAKNDAVMRDVFGTEEQCSIDQNVIIFDSVKSEFLTERGAEHNTVLFRKIAKAVAGDVIYKFHPRDKSADLSLPHFENPGIPFECCCFWRDLSDKTIVTVMSTAAFSPKLVFDQEPKVILLYKLLKEDMTVTDIHEKLFHDFKMLYRDKSKVIIPETVSEFNQIIKGLEHGE